MKKFAFFAVAVLFVGIVTYVSQRGDINTVNYNTYDAVHLDWCDSIYHQNVGCPKHGQVEIPPAFLAKQEANHLAWCESIYHRNVSCPKYGQVTVPAAVLVRENAEHLAWCKRIDYRNVGCSAYEKRYDHKD